MPFPSSIVVGDSHASVPIRSYLSVDYVKRCANGISGDTSREGGKDQCKGVKL